MTKGAVHADPYNSISYRIVSYDRKVAIALATSDSFILLRKRSDILIIFQKFSVMLDFYSVDNYCQHRCCCDFLVL